MRRLAEQEERELQELIGRYKITRDTVGFGTSFKRQTTPLNPKPKVKKIHTQRGSLLNISPTALLVPPEPTKHRSPKSRSKLRTPLAKTSSPMLPVTGTFSQMTAKKKKK